MTKEWLLFDVLDTQPSLVAQGEKVRKFVPIELFLRRSHNREAISAAIARTLALGRAVTTFGADRSDAIHAVPVIMTDGVIHGVHVWAGKTAMPPPPRGEPGAIVWNLHTGAASSTPRALHVGGKNPATESTHGRNFIADMPATSINLDESQLLSFAINRIPGETFCSTWDFKDHTGLDIRAGFASRVRIEVDSLGQEVPICRAMNWRVQPEASPKFDVYTLAQQIVYGLAQPGLHRALVDLKTWRLLKWIDEPCPYFNWQQTDLNQPLIHPDDTVLLDVMAAQFADGHAEGTLRLRGLDEGWTPIRVTVHQVKLQPDTVAGVATFSQP